MENSLAHQYFASRALSLLGPNASHNQVDSLHFLNRAVRGSTPLPPAALRLQGPDLRRMWPAASPAANAATGSANTELNTTNPSLSAGPSGSSSSSAASVLSTSTSSSSDGVAYPTPSVSSSNPVIVTPTATRIVKDVNSRDDPCTWHQTQTFCGDIRSCNECLNVPLASGQECTIVPGGYCASISTYDPALDYRRNNLSAALNSTVAVPGPNYFPSANTTYCAGSDVKCLQCRATLFKESTDGLMNPSQFCLGRDGCVCVGFCESTVWEPVAVDMTCQKSSPVLVNGQVALEGPLRTVAFIVVLCITIPVVVIVGYSFRVRWLREQERRRLHQARLDARAPPLVLSGWKALREELIENEHQSQATQDVTDGVVVSVSGGLDPLPGTVASGAGGSQEDDDELGDQAGTEAEAQEEYFDGERRPASDRP